MMLSIRRHQGTTKQSQNEMLLCTHSNDLNSKTWPYPGLAWMQSTWSAHRGTGWILNWITGVSVRSKQRRHTGKKVVSRLGRDESRWHRQGVPGIASNRQKLGKEAQNRFFPRAFRRNQLCLIPWLLDSGLQHCERINPCSLSHSVSGKLLQQV